MGHSLSENKRRENQKSPESAKFYTSEKKPSYSNQNNALSVLILLYILSHITQGCIFTHILTLFHAHLWDFSTGNIGVSRTLLRRPLGGDWCITHIAYMPPVQTGFQQ